ncbi:M48 family metallopeptidase [Saccharopolyspora sp. SCSIO 74807]|uniref:M48 family metallopeptidase n=1 Tax=Saccharopolyspora sp. SCSIO 74807 TaxID=3118084 RepID=UPI0030D0BF6F
MRGPWRAALALALHIGFFAFPLAVVLGLLGITAYTVRADIGLGARAGLAAFVVAAVVGIGLRTVLRSQEIPRGVALKRAEQPKVWKVIDTVCTGSGAQPPDEVRITSEPGSLLREDTALLGLRVRARYLEIGLPLLAGLSASDLRAVAARELGRTVGAGRLVVLADRVRTSVLRTAEGLTGGPAKWLFTGYARAYAAVAGDPGANLWFGADTIAVQAAGKRAAVTSLRKVQAVEFGWRAYAEEYLTMAAKVEHTPDLLLGFRAFMDHPERKPELSERVKQAIAEERGVRPSTRERVEAMKRLRGGDRDPDDRPAFALLREPRETVPALEDRLLVDGLGPRLPWPDLARKAGAAAVARQAGLLASAVRQSGLDCQPAIGGVLAAIHRDQRADLINPVLNPGLSPEKLDEAVVDTLTELLGGAVVDALVCAGRAQHELDWAGESVVRLSTGHPLDPDRLVRPAVQDPRLVPGLHRALVDLGVPLQHYREPADDPDPSISGVVSPVQYAGGRFDMVVTDRGLVLVPSAASPAKRLLAGAVGRLRKAENEELCELSETPVQRLREQADAQWIDSRDVAVATLVQERSGWSLTLELYLDDASMSTVQQDAVQQGPNDIPELIVRSSGDSEERGDPYRGLGELMGARMSIDDRRGAPAE